MSSTHARAHASLDVACRALEPYQWRRLTTQMVVRRVLAALDRHRAPGGADVDVVPRGDRRVEELGRVLDGQPWRALAVGEVVRRLLEALDDWELRDACLDLELAWLLDGA